MRDDKQKLKIELLSQRKLEAESRKSSAQILDLARNLIPSDNTQTPNRFVLACKSEMKVQIGKP